MHGFRYICREFQAVDQICHNYLAISFWAKSVSFAALYHKQRFINYAPRNEIGTFESNAPNERKKHCLDYSVA